MAAARGTTGVRRLLLCRVGALVCGLPLEHVVEIMRPLPAQPLAQMPGFVSGLSLIRGRPTPVLDARRLLGVGAGAPQRYVSVRLEKRSAVLAVDGVVGVRAVESAVLAALPPILRESNGELVTAIGSVDEALLLVLEHTRLLPEAVWKALEQEAGAA